MKLAKVSKGRVHHVWPHEKTLPDGRVVIKICPYQNNAKERPDCIVEVPDEVQAGWVWHEDVKQYGPVIKAEVPRAKRVREIIREELMKIDSIRAELLAQTDSTEK